MLEHAYYRLRETARTSVARFTPLPETDPVIVYSTRKVASTTITRTLRAHGVDTYKQHCLNPVLAREFSAALRRLGAPDQHWLYDGRMCRGRLERWRRRHAGTPARCRLITLVKDPLAIAASDFFMQLFEFLPDHADRAGLRDGERLARLFAAVIDPAHVPADALEAYLALIVSLPERWLARELAEVFAIDPLAAPFPHARGFRCYDGRSCTAVILRAEDVDRCAIEALGEFLGLQIAALSNDNVTGETANGALYASFKRHVALPRELVTALYARAPFRHFYTADEIASFAARWTGGEMRGAG